MIKKGQQLLPLFATYYYLTGIDKVADFKPLLLTITSRLPFCIAEITPTESIPLKVFIDGFVKTTRIVASAFHLPLKAPHPVTSTLIKLSASGQRFPSLSTIFTVTNAISSAFDVNDVQSVSNSI